MYTINNMTCNELVPLIKFLSGFRWENLETNIGKGSKNATRNYHTIGWTPKRSFELSELYSLSSVGMQCQAGGGEQLPGDWTNLNIPPIKKVHFSIANLKAILPKI